MSLSMLLEATTPPPSPPDSQVRENVWHWLRAIDAGQHGRLDPNETATPPPILSPSKRRRLKTSVRHEPLQATWGEDMEPLSLRALRQDLVKIDRGYGILPSQARSELEDLELPDFFFSVSSPSSSAASSASSASSSSSSVDGNEGGEEKNLLVLSDFPPRSTVKDILSRANECYTFGSSEPQWKFAVYSKVLSLAFNANLKIPPGQLCLRVVHSPSATISPEYRIDQKSPNIDYCLLLALPKTPKYQDAVQRVITQRPNMSVNQTDTTGQLMVQPIALSIVVKRHGEDHNLARLQLALWRASQWKCLQDGPTTLSKIDFLAGITVRGHDWEFCASVLRGDVPYIYGPGLRIGDTRSEEGLYKLLLSLRRLRVWAEQDYRVAFEHDILQFEE